MKTGRQLLIQIICTIGFALALAGCGRPHLPTDGEVTARWLADQAEIKHMKELLDRQPTDIVGLGPQGVMLKSALTQVTAREAGMKNEDLAEFYSGMKRLGILALFRSEGETKFLFASSGMANRGFRVFFTAKTSPPEEQLIRSMAEFRRQPKGWTTAYRPLESGWYVEVLW